MTPQHSDSLSTALAEVLAAHELHWVRPYRARCSCGRWDSRRDAAGEHRRHVVEQMSEVIDRHVRRVEARQRRRIATAIGLVAARDWAERGDEKVRAAYRRAVRLVHGDASDR